jgi:uncharacterized protein (DUF1697 family)
MFLWNEIDDKSILEKLNFNQEVDKLIYIPGCVIWNLKKDSYNKSAMNDLISNPLYKKMTVRNINTVRKILDKF